MINIETIKHLVQKEFGVNLIEKDDYYCTANEVVYVKEYADGFYVSLTKHSRKHRQELSITLFTVIDEQRLITNIRKFKRIRKLF